MWKCISLTATVTALTFFAAPEVRANPQEASLVESWYRRYLGRCADAPSLNAYVSQLCRGRPAFEIEAELLGSSEYYHRNGCDDHMFIRALYRDVLGAGCYADDLQQWCRRLHRFGSREELARRFLIELRGRNPQIAPVATYVPSYSPVQPALPTYAPSPVYVPVPVTAMPPAPVFVAPVHRHHPGYFAPVPPGVSVSVRFPL